LQSAPLCIIWRVASEARGRPIAVGTLWLSGLEGA